MLKFDNTVQNGLRSGYDLHHSIEGSRAFLFALFSNKLPEFSHFLSIFGTPPKRLIVMKRMARDLLVCF